MKLEFHSGTQLSFITDLLSLRLAGAVGARNYVRSLYSQRVPRILTKVLTVASSVFLPLNYRPIP